MYDRLKAIAKTKEEYKFGTVELLKQMYENLDKEDVSGRVDLRDNEFMRVREK